LMEHRLQLKKNYGGEIVDATRYRSIIGSLRYLVNTRFDIAHAVELVSRDVEAPNKEHSAAVKRYVHGTIVIGCWYKGGDARLVGFSGSAHASNINDTEALQASSSSLTLTLYHGSHRSRAWWPFLPMMRLHMSRWRPKQAKVYG
jgi:hypothetical protein